MTGHPSDEELGAFIDGRLSADAAENIRDHLATCDSCSRLVEGIEPITFAPTEPPQWDESRFGRVVRATILRMAATTLALGFIGAVALALLLPISTGFFLIRSGKAELAMRATVEAALMSQPGSVITGWRYDQHALSRTQSVTVGMRIGSSVIPLGKLTSVIGVFGDRLSEPLPAPSAIASESTGLLAPLPSGTVATVRLSFVPSISSDAIRTYARDHTESEIVWIGFAVGEHPNGSVGFPTCTSPSFLTDVATGFLTDVATGGFLGGGGMGLTYGGFPYERDLVGTALSGARTALADFERIPSLIPAPVDFQGNISTLRSQLDEPNPPIGSIVATGPTPAIIAMINDLTPRSVEVLATSLWNWTGPGCTQS